MHLSQTYAALLGLEVHNSRGPRIPTPEGPEQSPHSSAVKTVASERRAKREGEVTSKPGFRGIPWPEYPERAPDGPDVSLQGTCRQARSAAPTLAAYASSETHPVYTGSLLHTWLPSGSHTSGASLMTSITPQRLLGASALSFARSQRMLPGWRLWARGLM